MPYQFKNSWEIEGLDDPMIAPWLIPKGMVQEYNQDLKEWRVRRSYGNNPKEGYSVQELFRFPEITRKLYSMDTNDLYP